MLNGTHEIDRTALGQLAHAAREAKGYSQLQAAASIGVGQNWISRLEKGILGLYGDNIVKIAELAAELGFEFKAPSVEASVTPTTTPQPKPQLPAVIETSDHELAVMQACAAQLAKLKDRQACRRIISYLNNRFVYPDGPIERPNRSRDEA